MRTVVAAGLVLILGGTLAAQIRRTPPQSAESGVPVAVALKVGGQAIASSGTGTCTHAPVASIYDLRAEQWRVELSSGPQSTTLTVWHPATGSDMFNLGISNGNTRRSVNTVKVGTNGTPEGSGSVTLAKEGKGGTFTLSATTADGTKLTGTIKCDAFTAAIAEGGN